MRAEHAAVADTPLPVSGFLDRLGDRVQLADRESGRVEVLRLRPELTASPLFEPAVRRRAEQLAGFLHPHCAKVRQIGRLPAPDGRLVIVSDTVDGWRLSEVLEAAGPCGVAFHANAVLFLLRQLLDAVAALHDVAPGVSHGALGTERLIITVDGRLMVTESVLGGALWHLPSTSPDRLWRDLRLAVADGEARPFGRRTDLRQIGIVALSLALGRQLRRDEYPARMAGLLQEWTPAPSGLDADAFGPALRGWLRRILSLTDELTPWSVAEARRELNRLVESDARYAFAPTGLPVVLAAVADYYAAAVEAPVSIQEPSRRPDATVEPVRVVPPAPAKAAPSVAAKAVPPVAAQAVPPVAAQVAPSAPVQVAAPVAAQVVPPAPVKAVPPVTTQVVPPAPVPVVAPATAQVVPPAPVQVAAPAAAPRRDRPVAPVAEPSALSAHVDDQSAHGSDTKERQVSPRPVPNVAVKPEPAGQLSPSSADCSGRAAVVAPLADTIAPEWPHAEAGGRHRQAHSSGGASSSRPFLGVDLAQDGDAPLPAPSRTRVRTLIGIAAAAVVIVALGGYALLGPSAVGATATRLVSSPPSTEAVDAAGPAAVPPGGTAPRVDAPAAPPTAAPGPPTAAPGPPVAAPGPPVAMGAVEVVSPVRLDVSEGGRPLGASGGPIQLSVGRHTLNIGREDLGYQTVQVVDVKPGRPHRIEPALPSGVANLNATPWAEVWIDGRKVGETPLGRVQLTIGSHDIQFRHPELGDQTRTLVVTTGAVALLSVDMRK